MLSSPTDNFNHAGTASHRYTPDYASVALDLMLGAKKHRWSALAIATRLSLLIDLRF